MTLVCLCLVGSWSALLADEQATKTERAEEFAKAAQNYELASDARVETAEALLAVAREYRKNEYKDEAERQKNIREAGKREKQAGWTLEAAVFGYDKAAAAWSKSAAEYRKANNPDKAHQMQALCTQARLVGTGACKQAAKAFEAAAEAYSTLDLGQVAAVSEKAAEMRERLATRIK